MTSCNDNINDRTLYAMYSSDMQKAYSSTYQGHSGLSTVLARRRKGGGVRNSRARRQEVEQGSGGKECRQGERAGEGVSLG